MLRFDYTFLSAIIIPVACESYPMLRFDYTFLSAIIAMQWA